MSTEVADKHSVIILPTGKTYAKKRAREDVEISVQHQRRHSALDTITAVEVHLLINELPTDARIFAYKATKGNPPNTWRPLTRRTLVKDFNMAMAILGKPSITGHSFRAGGARLYSGQAPSRITSAARALGARQQVVRVLLAAAALFADAHPHGSAAGLRIKRAFFASS
jgi:integrase